MAQNRKSIVPFEVDYNFDSFPLGYGSGQGKVKILSKSSASWPNGLITVTENTASIKPTIYSSFREGNDRLQPNKPIDSSEYFPLATITVTNNQEPDGTLFLYNPGQIPLDSTINLAIKGGTQNINFAPLKRQRIYIGFKDFPENRENNINKDTVVFPNVGPYQNLQIINPQTRSAFSFGYVGAVQGGPKQITKDALLVPGGKAGNTAELNDGQTKTFTLYGRLFAVDIFDPIKIVSISEDTGIKGDFRTNDTTLIFNGTAEAGSKVEVFLDNKSIGIAYANDRGNWLHNYSQVRLPDGKYILTAAETNLFGEVKTTIPSQLEIDTDYDIDLDFSDPSVANNPKVQELQAQIRKAATYWEDIIENDIPDVNDPAVGGWIDDLKIKFTVGNGDGRRGGSLAQTNTIPKRVAPEYIRLRDPLTGQPPSTNYLPYHTIIEIDSADLNDITGTDYGLETLKHEIAHAIGFNSETFKQKGLIKDLYTESFNASGIYNEKYKYKWGFTGSKALDAYHALRGNATHTSVPLEDDKGLTPSHWNEWLFPDGIGEKVNPSYNYTDELMTTATPEPPKWKPAILSKLTLGAFEDLGFNVDDSKAGNINVFTGNNTLFNIPY